MLKFIFIVIDAAWFLRIYKCNFIINALLCELFLEGYYGDLQFFFPY